MCPINWLQVLKLNLTHRDGKRWRNDRKGAMVEALTPRLLLSALNPLPLSSLNGTNGFRLDGIDAGDNSGISVSSAGDVNGDGFDDVIIGADNADAGASNSGESYVVFGRSGGFASALDLSSLDGNNGFRLNGVDAADSSGVSVSSAGDVNGDGFDDLIVGADGTYAGANHSGQSYLVFGKSGGFASALDLSSLDGSNGFRMNGVDAGDLSGGSVSSAGDVNGDGFDDLIIAADHGGANHNGESYVVLGKPNSFASSLDLSSLNGSNGFRINGLDPSAEPGVAVSAAGDVNGDGFGDLIIGAYRGNAGGNLSGESYLVFGKSGGFASLLEFSSLNGNNGFRLVGVDPGDRSGGCVSSAGDVNGDGFDDLIIAASHAYSGGIDGGESYVVFGKSGGFASSFDLSSLNGSNGFRLNGIDTNDRSGRQARGAGDVNGDGFDDLIIGSPFVHAGPNYSGESYVVFGKSGSFTSTLDLSSLNGSIGFKLDGIDAYDYSGFFVNSAGDVNGDGFDDLIIGAFSGDADATDAGESYVVFGGNFTGGAETQIGGGTASSLTAVNGAARDVLIGGGGNDILISDGGPDVLIGGEGNDILAIPDANFSSTRRIVGGTGTNTLRLDGSGISLDLTTIRDNRIQSINVIDIVGNGANTLTLNKQEVLNISSHSNTLIVRRGPDDIVNPGTGWVQIADEWIGGSTFEVFSQGAATLKIQSWKPPREITVFSTDFESGIPAEITGPGIIRDSEGYHTEAFLQNTSVPQNASTVLTLTGLPEHRSIRLDFLLAIINSWDGADGASSPDVFNVSVDGKTIFSNTFDNFVLSSQAYVPPAGVLLTPRIGPTISVSPDSFSNLGLDTGIGQEEFWGDALYAMGNDPTFSGIPHTSSTLTVEWFASGAGYQGGGNESWAIDDLSVTLEAFNGAPDITFFSTDFESGIPAEISGPGFIRGSEGYNTGNFLQNTAVPQLSSTVLKLTNLPEHTSVSLDFLLAIINSWDGADGEASPDFFNASVDGRTLFSEAFDNFVLSSQTYLPPDGVLLTPRIGATASFSPNGFANLGLDTGLGQEEFWGDALYAMGNEPTFNLIPHTSSTLTVEWYANGAGYQGGSNESWAIDNLSVTLGGVKLAKPSIDVPATTTSQRPLISWPAVAGASLYEVWINDLSRNASAVIRTSTPELSYVPTTELGIGRFRVWVRAFAGSEIVSDWSQGRDFSVVTSVGLTSLNPVQLTHRPTLTWSSLPGADHYDIWINNLSSGVAQIVRSSNISLTYFTIPKDLPIGSYRAWARGIARDSAPGAWSSAVNFNITPGPEFTHGANTTFNQSPVLQWTSLPGATTYDLWIDDRSTGLSQSVRNDRLTSTTFAASEPMRIGNYRAWIRGVGEGNFKSNWSSAIDFRITASPTVIPGSSLTFDNTPTLRWNNLPGAAVYEVYLRNQSTGAVVLEQRNISSSQFTLGSGLADGPYRWWVRAETSDGLRSLWSAPADFTIGGRTRLITPSGSISDSTPTFTWQQVDGAVHYDLWVDKVGGQAQIIRQEALTGTSFTPTTSLAAGSYRAWIRAVDTNGDVSVWSTSVEFRVVAKEALEDGRDFLSPTVAALPARLLQSVHDSREAIVPHKQRTLPIAGSIESTSESAMVQDDSAYEAQQSRELFRRNNERVDAVMAEFAEWCFTR
ncbi:MAG: FG-GAP repeat protein [Planctomycetaceae bacterium]|nr:FG-GAP repeat protein [Planctomycetaceae bacterium]